MARSSTISRTNNPQEPGRPATKAESSDFKAMVAQLVYAGRTPGEIARALHPDDKAEAKRMRNSIRRMAHDDDEFAMFVAQRAKGDIVLNLGNITRALIKRAERGRVDAIKLLFEASGFHNPRVQHEHSGDIQISLNIPRPERAEPAPVHQLEEPAVDAEVVEE